MENEVTIKVTIWNEGRHEKLHPTVAAVYPSGIHAAISCCIPGTIRNFSVG
jgi:trehalose utilization protein